MVIDLRLLQGDEAYDEEADTAIALATGDPTPAQIREATAKIRETWTDENGVSLISPADRIGPQYSPSTKERKMKRQKIYLIGPLRSGNECQNRESAARIIRRLIDAGYSPFAPHLYIADPGNEIPEEGLLDACLPWLDTADAVLLADNSTARTRAEYDRARRQGIPIFRTYETLADFCHRLKKA